MEAVPLGKAYVVPEEERRKSSREAYADLIVRLSRQSVSKHFDAYTDVEWERADHRIEPDDPRWELAPDHVLGATAWYQALPQPTRARLGLHLVACSMRVGLEFENVLTRGLLEFALELPDTAPEFRYVYHEAIEESQHTLMFREFIVRTGLATRGISPWQKLLARRIVASARNFPELFFVFVLGGEDPIDHVQREALRAQREQHPLLRRVSQIHVTEEARHLCFAREYLKARVPALGPVKQSALALLAPMILGQMARLMMKPSSLIVSSYCIPDEVLREAYHKNPVHRQRVHASLAKVRGLLGEVGLITPASRLVWKRLGLLPVEPS